MAAAMLAYSGAASADVIVFEDFNDGVADGFSGANSVETAPSTEKFLGVLTLGQTASLAVNTVGFTNIVLNFDLYVIRSMDGNDGYYGPDPFQVKVNGTTVFDYTFSNWDPNQSYPIAGSPAGTGSDASLYGNLGYANFYGTNSVYHISLNLGSGVTSLDFIGATSQPWDDEGYGVDNFSLTGDRTGGVPEPATWALMILGFGSIGSMIRRHRAATTV